MKFSLQIFANMLHIVLFTSLKAFTNAPSSGVLSLTTFLSSYFLFFLILFVLTFRVRFTFLPYIDVCTLGFLTRLSLKLQVTHFYLVQCHFLYWDFSKLSQTNKIRTQSQFTSFDFEIRTELLSSNTHIQCWNYHNHWDWNRYMVPDISTCILAPNLITEWHK